MRPRTPLDPAPSRPRRDACRPYVSSSRRYPAVADRKPNESPPVADELWRRGILEFYNTQKPIFARYIAISCYVIANIDNYGQKVKTAQPMVGGT